MGSKMNYQLYICLSLYDIMTLDIIAPCKGKLDFSHPFKTSFTRSGGNGDIRRLLEAGYQDRHSC